MSYKIRKCILCGEEFIPTSSNQRFCKTNDCYREHKRIREHCNDNLAIARRNRRYAHKDESPQLTKDAMEANKLGLTYGTYKGVKYQQRTWGW